MAEQYVTNVNEKNLVLNRAKAAVISHDFTTAARLYKQLLRDEPSNVDYLKELGAIYVKNQEDDKAIPYYEQIITFYPHYVEAMNSLGAIFRRLKRYEDSIKILQKALDEGRQTSTVNYNLGFTYKEMGNFDDAIDAFEAVIGENPSDVLAYNHLGMIYLSKKEYEKSIATFRRGLQVDPNHPILNYNLAHCYEEAKMPNDSIRCYDKALKARPGWIDAIKDFSTLLIKSQKTKEASDLVQRSIQLHPNDSKLLGMLGNIYLDQYDYDSAEKAFKRANAVDGNDVDILRGLAQSLEKGEKTQEALAAVTKALEIEPENEDIKKQYVHTLLSAEEYDAAHDNVQGLYKDNGQEDPQVLDLYGQYCICTNQDEQAQEYYDEIEKNSRQYKDHILSAAGRYNQIGKTDEAKVKAKEFISKAGKNPEGYHMLGNIYAKEGDYEKAIESFTTSKALFKPNILADKQISQMQAMMAKKPEVPETEEIPTEEIAQEENPVVEEAPVVETDQKDDEFDFGTMGDNVPMGEALLENEDDFFDDLDKATEDIVPDEEEIEEPEEEEKDEPAPYEVKTDSDDDSTSDSNPDSASDSDKPYKNPYENLEDESLSPFDDMEEEPKSVSEQLLPDVDFSDDDKEPEEDETSFFDNIPNTPKKDAEKEESKDTAQDPYSPQDSSSQEDSGVEDEPFDFGPEPVSNNEDDTSGYQEGGNKMPDSSAYEPDNGLKPSGKQESAPSVPDFDQMQPSRMNDAGANQQNKPAMSDFEPMQQPQPQSQNIPPQPAYNPPAPSSSPYDMESSMSQFANEMQKRMQNAMMDSAKFAMDTAMNAQKLAAQIAEEQEKLKNKVDSMPQPMPQPMAEPEQTIAPEPVQDTIPAQEEAPVLDGTDQDSMFVEPEQETEFGAEAEDLPMENSDDLYTEPETAEEPVVEEVSEPAAAFQQAESFPNISEILSDLGGESPDGGLLPVEENLMTPSAILPKIEKILENDEIAEENSPKLELFKKLLSFREYLTGAEREEFDSGKIRMLLEYIIAKMSGKAGLLKTAQSLIKSGLLGDEVQLSEEEICEETNNALVKKVLNIMKELAGELEDKSLGKALCNCADSVLERIIQEEKRADIF